jgi:hypothetical protein
MSFPSLQQLGGEPRAIIISQPEGRIVVIGKDMEIAKSVLSKIHEEFEKISGYSKDFGVTFYEFVFGNDIAIQNLRAYTQNNKIEVVGKSKNDFEVEVINSISEITDCMVTNTKIQFSKPNEEFEYDIIIPLSNNLRLNIEVTDYETVKNLGNNNNLKSKIILTTMDKAKRLDASVFIVAKGLPETIFNQLGEISNSRGIPLLNDMNYRKILEEAIIKKGIEFGSHSILDYDLFTHLYAQNLRTFGDELRFYPD